MRIKTFNNGSYKKTESHKKVSCDKQWFSIYYLPTSTGIVFEHGYTRFDCNKSTYLQSRKEPQIIYILITPFKTLNS